MINQKKYQILKFYYIFNLLLLLKIQLINRLQLSLLLLYLLPKQVIRFIN